jgi:hypothetical protein
MRITFCCGIKEVAAHFCSASISVTIRPCDDVGFSGIQQEARCIGRFLFSPRGFAVMNCSDNVIVNAVYKLLKSDGTVLSMATIFSQGPLYQAAVTAIQSLPDKRIALAIANPTQQDVTCILYTYPNRFGG